MFGGRQQQQQVGLECSCRRGWAQRGTHAGEMLTPDFSSSSRDLSAAAGVNLTTYGMVGDMTGHMTGL